MSAAYVCTRPWCTVDHDVEFDRFDREGSRFHWGVRQEFAVPDESSPVWSRGQLLDVQWVEYWDATGEHPGEIRAQVNDCGLDESELRSAAAWLFGRADELARLNAEANYGP